MSGIPNYKEGKLLGIPVISDGTGTTQASTTHGLIKQWKVENAVVGLVYDTTASNAGWKNGACVILEALLGRKVFYFACRHHIMERILCAVWQALFGETSSPDNPDFKHFKNHWIVLDKSKCKILYIQHNYHYRLLNAQREVVIRFLCERL